MKNFRAFLRLIRPEHWLKNLFIFLPAFFNGSILIPGISISLLISFISFSLIASSVYIFNDYCDIDNDRLHPEKKKRPLAANEISKNIAFAGMIIFLFSGLILAFLQNIVLLWIALSYLIINIAYTLRLKNIAILDVNIIAIGFIIRILFGGITSNVIISKWLWIITYLLALILAFGKRRTELSICLNSGEQTRKSITGYSLEFINNSIVFMVAVLVVSYIMYSISPEVTLRLNSEHIYLTSFFVVLGMLRFLQQTMVFNNTGSPSNLLVKDRFIQLILVGWTLMFVYFIYFPKLSF